MDRVELNLLAFLVESIVLSRTPQEFAQIEKDFEKFGTRSADFKKAVNVLKQIVESIPNNTTIGDRMAQIEDQAKLIKNGGKINQSVFEILTWSLNNLRGKSKQL